MVTLTETDIALACQKALDEAARIKWLSPLDTVYRADGTVDIERSEQQQAARDKQEKHSQ